MSLTLAKHILSLGCPCRLLRSITDRMLRPRSSLTIQTRSFMNRIKRVEARQIFDSRGTPTVEVDVHTPLGRFSASVPSGASTGKYEAVEKRDEDDKYMGKGVTKVVKSINNLIGPAVLSKKFKETEQVEIDCFLAELDGTDNKEKLGANALLGISMAVARAGAAKNKMPLYKYIANLAEDADDNKKKWCLLKRRPKKRYILPVPAFNVINGGVHAPNALPFQEFMIMPTGATCFSEAMRIGVEVYHCLGEIFKGRKWATTVAFEGGYAPPISDVSEALQLIMEAISTAGHEGKVQLALDVAASEFYRDSSYDLGFKGGEGGEKTPDKMLSMYKELSNNFPIVSIEDPYEQDDWDNWCKITRKMDIQIVGDDLTVTNVKRIKEAIRKKACNCLLLKVNQIGTLSEAIAAHKRARAAGWGTMVSHRSGDTEDHFIADLAVGLNAGQIKTGAPSRSERNAKYNQLLRIEEELCGGHSEYAGENFRNPDTC